MGLHGARCAVHGQQPLRRLRAVPGDLQSRGLRVPESEAQACAGAGQDVAAAAAEAEPAAGPVELLLVRRPGSPGSGRQMRHRPGAPPAPGSSRPQTAARALFTIRAPGLSGTIAGHLGDAGLRGGPQVGVRNRTQQLPAGPRGADARPRFGDGGGRNGQFDVVLPCPGQPVQDRRQRHRDIGFRRLRQAPWCAGQGWWGWLRPAAAAAAHRRRRPARSLQPAAGWRRRQSLWRGWRRSSGRQDRADRRSGRTK